MRTYISLFILLLYSLHTNATEVTLSEARATANKLIVKKWKNENKDIFIINENIKSINTKAVFYIFNLNRNNGFVIVSAESTTAEILAYSFEGNYNTNNIPDALSDLLTQYAEEIQFVRDNYIQDKSEIKTKTKNTNFITPLLSSKWDQSCYYNDSCPSAPSAGAYYCNHVPAGCVAICLAQIIKYHQYPQIGQGTNSYYSPYYGTLQANFANTNYNYSNMPDVLFASNTSVSQLVYHCGIAVNMDYKPLYSGAGINEARNALVNYFKYATSTQIVYKSSFTDVAWKTLIKSELDSARPVFYSGYNQNNNGGHAFICDGYQANDFFHINWGWGGQFDGYFLLSALNPGSNNFSYNHSAIIGIKPQNIAPVAHFTANQTTINKGGSVNFTDLSSGNPSSWNWTFAGGNPGTSNQKNPQNITYNLSGIYPVSLSVTNLNGSNNLTKTTYITVAPIAGFTSNKTQIAVGESISFYDNSIVISQPTSRLWTFEGGNPSASTLANPANISYMQPGTYKVSLTINTAEGNHTITKNNFITVYSNCIYQFKDSIPKYFINPQNAANFQINQEDFDSLTPYYAGHSTKWNVFNKVNSPGDTNFFYGATSFFTTAGQANNWLEFGPLTIPQNGAVLKWDHLYYLNTKRDGYEVLISTTGISRDYYTSPPLFSRTDNDPLTNNDTIWVNQEVKIDKNIYGGQQIYIAFHHFANNKYYLFLDNLKLLSCSGLPVNADFASDSTNINQGSSVNFYDNSNGNPISWKWTFYGGSPQTSDLQNPTAITYNSPGNHTVKLVVNNGEQTDSISKTNFIFVNNTGIFANEILKKIQLFPNPFQNQITLKLSENYKKNLNISIYDLLGNRLKFLKFPDEINSVSVSMSEFSKGIYFIEISDNESSVFKKIIKSQ